MNTKKLLSAAAAVAVMSTGAMAFDTNTDGELLSTDSSTAAGLYDFNSSAEANSTIQKIGEGQMGNALIYPAFFAGGGDDKWQSEFSIINNSDNAVIAKVVLYGAQDSVELRDFNVYLSAHDVFRATLKDGKIYSTDGSTVLPGSDAGKVVENTGTHVYNNTEVEDGNVTTTNLGIYKYKDDGEMVSADNPLDIFVDPNEESGGQGLAVDKDGNAVYAHTGYIAVFAMAEAKGTSYHKKHKELWQDYRHLVDTCRSINDDNGSRAADQEWRGGITRGLYNQVGIYTPNALNDYNASAFYTEQNCKFVEPSVLGDLDNVGTHSRKRVEFMTPGNVLSGSILVSHDGSDGGGSRDLLIKAYALGNVASSDANQTTFDDSNSSAPAEANTTTGGSQLLLWSEGEFAHLADRCIDHEEKKVKNADNEDEYISYAGYNEDCLDADADVLKVARTIYEFRDNTEGALLVTQPYKRVLLQRKKATHGRIRAWNNLSTDPIVNGEFRLKMELYNDDEDHFTPVLGAFTVSPATTSTAAGIPNELAMFNPFAAMSEADRTKYSKGYSILQYKNGTTVGLSAIVTQMAATIHDDKTAETNWIYPLSLED